MGLYRQKRVRTISYSTMVAPRTFLKCPIAKSWASGVKEAVALATTSIS